MVERAINRLEDFGPVATPYEKRGHNYVTTAIIATMILQPPQNSIRQTSRFPR